MNHAIIVALLASGVAYGTPLLIAGLGELLNERGGVLNLGLEGMMLVGAACGFWLVQILHGPSSLVLLAAAAGAGAAGACMAAVFAVACLVFRANQVVAGLALAIFGGAAGLSTYLAAKKSLAGTAARYQFRDLGIPGLKSLPVLGPVLFDQNALVYVSWVLVIAAAVYLYRTQLGLHLRAAGEDPAAADATGIPVTAYRFTHTLIGGVLAGVAGTCYSLSLTPSWSNGLTAGNGWIALGLVIFAFWRPGLLVIGAYLFGIITGLGFVLQAHGVNLPSELYSALPYVAVIVILVLTSSIWHNRRLGAPAALGRYFAREG